MSIHMCVCMRDFIVISKGFKVLFSVPEWLNTIISSSTQALFKREKRKKRLILTAYTVLPSVGADRIVYFLPTP